MASPNHKTEDKRAHITWKATGPRVPGHVPLVDVWLVDHPHVRVLGAPAVEAFAAIDGLARQAGLGGVRYPDVAELPSEVRADLEPPIRTMAKVTSSFRRW